MVCLYAKNHKKGNVFPTMQRDNDCAGVNKMPFQKKSSQVKVQTVKKEVVDQVVYVQKETGKENRGEDNKRLEFTIEHQSDEESN